MVSSRSEKIVIFIQCIWPENQRFKIIRNLEAQVYRVISSSDDIEKLVEYSIDYVTHVPHSCFVVPIGFRYPESFAVLKLAKFPCIYLMCSHRSGWKTA